ncbi:MAG: hypothetical protein K8S54_13655 [Spirochaetia bacterium]|nr:hypothetical protein [Spirochaetia bacterium]
MTNNSETINTVLVTAVGAPPGLNALRALQESGRYHLVASDADRMSPSLYTAGVRGHVLPKANHPDYIPALMRLIKAEKIDLVIP